MRQPKPLSLQKLLEFTHEKHPEGCSSVFDFAKYLFGADNAQAIFYGDVIKGDLPYREWKNHHRSQIIDLIRKYGGNFPLTKVVKIQRDLAQTVYEKDKAKEWYCQTNDDITLKALRKLVSRTDTKSWEQMRRSFQYLWYDLDIRRSLDKDRDKASRQLDRLISKYGGNTLLSAIRKMDEELQREERKKSTEEVDGSSQSGDTTHGGDSASQEVPDGHSEGGDAMPEGELCPSSGSSTVSTLLREGEQTDEEGGDSGEVASTPGQQPNSPSSSKGAEEKGALEEDKEEDILPHAGEEPLDQDLSEDSAHEVSDKLGTSGGKADAVERLRDCEQVSAQGGNQSEKWLDELSDLSPREGKSLGNKLTSSSGEARESFGGNHIPLSLRKANSKEKKKAVRALQAFITAVLPPGEEDSPRWNAGAIVKEKLISRWSLSRCRRRDNPRPKLLILPDVSGSCSASCGEALVASYACAYSDNRVTVIPHSNGYTFQNSNAVADGKMLQIKNEEGYNQESGEKRAIAEYIQKNNIEFCIALGDYDAADLYRQAAEKGVKVLWLDSFGASNGKPYQSRLSKDDLANHINIEYWKGCNDVNDFLQVMSTCKIGKK